MHTILKSVTRFKIADRSYESAFKKNNTTHKKWLIDYAAKLSIAAGEKVVVKGNSLVFPSSLAEGMFEFYEVGEGLGLLLLDCVFHKSLQVSRMDMPGNDTYIISYFLSRSPIEVINKDGAHMDFDLDLPNIVSFSSHSTQLKYIVKANQQVKALQLFFHRSWGVKNLLDNSIPLSIQRLRLFANNRPMQIFTNYDLKTVELINEMFANSTSRLTKAYLMEGYACKLVALFFNNIIEEEMGEKRVLSEDAMRVIQFKEIIEKNLEDIPTLTSAARTCLMSETRFSQMFKTLFKSNYSAFFLRARMECSRDLLLRGYSVTEAGHAIGYDNIGYFAKVFKEHFGDTPGRYQREKTSNDA